MKLEEEDDDNDDKKCIRRTMLSLVIGDHDDHHDLPSSEDGSSRSRNRTKWNGTGVVRFYDLFIRYIVYDQRGFAIGY